MLLLTIHFIFMFVPLISLYIIFYDLFNFLHLDLYWFQKIPEKEQNKKGRKKQNP